MSYDKFWVCRTADPYTWTERGQAQQEGKLVEFDTEFDRLKEQGHFVVLSHGANFAFDEIYVFEDENDAQAFYEEGFKGRQFRSAEFPDGYGFQEVTLYVAGTHRTSKSL